MKEASAGFRAVQNAVAEGQTLDAAFASAQDTLRGVSSSGSPEHRLAALRDAVRGHEVASAQGFQERPPSGARRSGLSAARYRERAEAGRARASGNTDPPPKSAQAKKKKKQKNRD
jgi:hypothetical protein